MVLDGRLPVAELTARTFHARWAAMVAAHLGTAVAVDSVPGSCVRFTATLPVAD